MPNTAITRLLLLFFLLLYSSNASVRCDGGAGNADYYLQFDSNQREIRDAILTVAGLKKRNRDGTYRYVSSRPSLVKEPVSCLFSLDAAGQITTAKILRSSGSDSIDQRALALIDKAAPFEHVDLHRSGIGLKPLIANFTKSDLTIFIDPGALPRPARRYMNNVKKP